MTVTDKPIMPYGEPLAPEYETLGRDELHRRLKVLIAELLEYNFEKLTNMIYRHDVDEAKFYEALKSGNIEQQAAKLADLVIDRELQKAETRKAYRKNTGKKKLE